jgi:hypothetical protein
VLDPTPQLSQHRFRKILWILSYKIDPDPLRSHKADHLLDLFNQRLRSIGKKKMGLIKEEDELRLFGVPNLWERFKELSKKPHQKCGIKARRLYQPRSVKHIDIPASVGSGSHQVRKLKSRLSEERLTALPLQQEQLPLHRAD